MHVRIQSMVYALHRSPLALLGKMNVSVYGFRQGPLWGLFGLAFLAQGQGMERGGEKEKKRGRRKGLLYYLLSSR